MGCLDLLLFLIILRNGTFFMLLLGQSCLANNRTLSLCAVLCIKLTERVQMLSLNKSFIDDLMFFNTWLKGF